MNSDIFSSGGPPPSNGLGNLADELADAWGDEEEDEEPDMNFAEAETGDDDMDVDGDGEKEVEPQRDSGVDVTSSPVQAPLRSATLTPPTAAGRGHRRQKSDYDGSDYGGESGLESPGMPPGLVRGMDMVESLARRGTERNGTERDGVVMRVIEGLRDLGGQSGVEGGATRFVGLSMYDFPLCTSSNAIYRLATAHSALSTHLLHQTRLLQNLAYPLLSPLSLPPDEEIIDEILPLLVTISESMPRPTAAAFNSLTQLHTLTADLVQTLNYLSDSLHMSRQTTTTATRRLRSARELVAEMKREEEEREEGERWLKRHNWGERLRQRECEGVCKDVVGGFEEVCNGWRARLVAQAEAVGA